MAGSNSKAPIPLLPIKHRISTGFMLSSGRPCCANHMRINSLPYLSGSTSANKPGKPLNVSIAGSAFFLREGNLKLFLPELIGICRGAISQSRLINFGSYSNAAMPEISSQATAPANSPHIFTNAVFIFTSQLLPDYLFFLCLALFLFSCSILAIASGLMLCCTSKTSITCN